MDVGLRKGARHAKVEWRVSHLGPQVHSNPPVPSGGREPTANGRQPAQLLLSSGADHRILAVALLETPRMLLCTVVVPTAAQEFRGELELAFADGRRGRAKVHHVRKPLPKQALRLVDLAGIG
jgi:hypothetical protein